MNGIVRKDVMEKKDGILKIDKYCKKVNPKNNSIGARTVPCGTEFLTETLSDFDSEK